MKRPFGSRFFPLAEWQDPPRTGPETGHGRIDLRGIALLPADAPGEHMRTTWPPVRTIARIERQRGHVRAGHSVKTETETTYPVTSPGQPDPDDILRLDRRHWRIEAMHRDRDVTPGEDGYTNRPGHAPRNILTLDSAARTLPERIPNSPAGAVETVQDNRRKAVRFVSDKQKNSFL